jgi:hypothetical protein
LSAVSLGRVLEEGDAVGNDLHFTLFTLLLWSTMGLSERLQLLGLDPSRPASIVDFVSTFYMAFGFLLLRLACERTLLPHVRTYLHRFGPSVRVADVFDNAYIGIVSGGFDALAIFIMLTNNGGCTPWSTDPCLEGWPHHPLLPIQR